LRLHFPVEWRRCEGDLEPTTVNWAILDGLHQDERDTVLATTARRRFRRRAAIVRQGDLGDSLHLLDRGRVAVQVSTSDGDIVTIGILGPGSYFGEQALVGDTGVRMAGVVALEPVETLALHRDDFERLRGQHPSVNGVLVRALSNRVDRLTDQLIETLFMSAETRVCRRLLELTELYRAPGSAETAVIGLTQEEIATLAGTSRPTVNRVLAELTQAGIVNVGRGTVEVNDYRSLAARCERP
jgi:CRP-like cAMP-binding protein